MALPTACHPRFALLMLTLIYAVAFVDRQILSITQEAIKHDLGLSDTQLGVLTGLAFSLFYVVVGIPVARYADRAIRRDVVALSLATWSVMTALTGFAGSYLHLFLARMGVGVGEAGCNPPSYSMIADLFPRERLAAAMSFYTTGVNFGVLAGFLAGGWLTAAYGWRATFFIVGIPGIVVAIIFRLTVREPRRGGADGPPSIAAPLMAGLRELARRRTLRFLAIAIAFSALVSYGSLSWAAPFLIRTHNMSLPQAGTALALIVGIGGALGSFGSGLLADRLARSDARWYLWLPAIVSLLLIPFLIAGYLATTATMALTCLAIPLALGATWSGVSLTVLNRIAPPAMRATASSLFLLVTNLFGVGLGSLAIGMASDEFRLLHGTESLRYALVCIVPAAAALASLGFAFAARSILNDID